MSKPVAISGGFKRGPQACSGRCQSDQAEIMTSSPWHIRLLKNPDQRTSQRLDRSSTEER